MLRVRSFPVLTPTPILRAHFSLGLSAHRPSLIASPLPSPRKVQNEPNSRATLSISSIYRTPLRASALHHPFPASPIPSFFHPHSRPSSPPLPLRITKRTQFSRKCCWFSRLHQRTFRIHHSSPNAPRSSSPLPLESTNRTQFPRNPRPLNRLPQPMPTISRSTSHSHTEPFYIQFHRPNFLKFRKKMLDGG